MTSEAIAGLRRDHEEILEALALLETLAEAARREGGRAPEKGALLLAYFRDFADRHHHGKEEGILFPALVEAGLPSSGGPVSVMLEEHELGRGILRRMEAALGPEGGAPAFAEAARDYVSFLRSHIDKENLVLFPMGERILDSRKVEEIDAACREREKVLNAGGGARALRAELEELRKSLA